MSGKPAEYVNEPRCCNYEIITSCDLLQAKCTDCNSSCLKVCDENQYSYSSDEEYQYPSASATYADYDNEQNSLSFLDSDFMEIFDELANSDEFIYSGLSSVALSVAYEMKEDKKTSSEDNVEMIQHATPIQTIEPKAIKSDPNKYSLYRQAQNTNRLDAISKWRHKRSQAVCKSTNKILLSARQEATARRPRIHGKFKKISAKWISATEYFHLEPKDFKSDVEKMLSTDESI